MNRQITSAGRLLSVFGLVSLLFAPNLSVAQAADALQPPLRPFVVDHFARQDGPADVRFLLEGPAGKDGFITVKGGHLADGKGRRFRCWGVNITGWTRGSTLLPPHHEAEVFARELARSGVNCVRLHFLDMPVKQTEHAGEGNSGSRDPVTFSPSGLISDQFNDSRHFDPDHLDRLDYWVAQLKGQGIYVDLNLNVGRSYRPGDGVPDSELLGVAKGVTYFGPELVALQKEYARKLLTHRNPYTGTEYRNEPAVAIVEIVNENSLLEFWMRNWFRGELQPGVKARQLDLTPHYKALLTGLFNDWLGRNRAGELPLIRKQAGVGAGDPVPLTRRGDFATAGKERFYAEAEFYTSVEQDFLLGMRDYLVKDLGVKSVVVPTADHTFQIAGQPLLRTTSKFAMQDGHIYWQHPAIYGARGTPMVNDPLHSVAVKLTRSAVVGQPYMVSEVNEPFPNDYAAEMIPILASYASFQDWDGVFFYTFDPKLQSSWAPVIGDHFDISQDPVKMAQMPAGAMIFLRGDVAAAKTVLERTYSREQVNEAIRLPIGQWPLWTPGFPLAAALEHGSRVRCLDCQPTAAVSLPDSDAYATDTGQITWRAKGGMDGLVTVDAPRSQALVGFVRGRGEAATTNLAVDIENPFASFTLSSMDGKPISRSDRLLLTASGKATNTGSAWNARHAMLSTWGGAPTLIEPITGWVQLRDLQGAVAVTATPLDGAGRPLAPVAARMLETSWELPIGGMPAISYLITVER